MTETGNLILNNQEIIDLRKSILDRYRILTGVVIEQKQLNSNVNNYGDLFVSIDNDVSLIKSLGIISPKPLIGIFHSPKKNPDKPKRFRKKLINAIYRYAHGCSRDEFISVRHYDTNSVSVKQMKNIGGYWQCYYSKNKNFFTKLEDSRKADIHVVALTITGENINKATVRFHQSENWGRGSVEVQGSNLIFHLRSEKNNYPTSLFMNCGGNYIQDREGHIKYAIGICVYITNSGLPKHSPCLMEYFTNERLENEFKTDEIDLTSDRFKKTFVDTKEISLDDRSDDCVERIVSLFQKEQPQLLYSPL